MTDLLTRIAHSLAVQDATPRLDGHDWVPGDPLYDEDGVHSPRRMFDVLDEWHPLPRCTDCDVSWVGPEPCWVCGAPSNDSRTSGWVDDLRFAGWERLIHVAPFVARRQVDINRYQGFCQRVAIGFDPGASSGPDIVVMAVDEAQLWQPGPGRFWAVQLHQARRPLRPVSRREYRRRARRRSRRR